MGGGLIQLVIPGIQDSPIIGNPEITFFKTVYRQHTMFSLCQNDRFIGNVEFGKEGTKVIEKNGDLLYNQTLRLEIPYFEIIKTQNVSELVKSEYDINELNITYMNSNCVVFNVNGAWYIIPEKLFKIGSFDNITQEIESSKIQDKLLPEFIKSSDFNNNVTFYNIKENLSSSIISLLRVESNYWEQFWLDFIDKTPDETYYNALQTLTSTYRRLHEDFRNRIFSSYSALNKSYKSVVDFAFTKQSLELDDRGQNIRKSETERYFEFINNFDYASSINDGFEIDKIYQYCVDNEKDFDIYKVDCLKYIPLVLKLLHLFFYSNNKQLFTFWKKYTVLTSNEINENIIETEQNFKNEWAIILNDLMDNTFKTNQIKNIIFDEFLSKYLLCEKNIQKLYQNLQFDNYKDIYSKLKIFMERFLSIRHYSTNYYNLYYPYKYVNETNPSLTADVKTEENNNDYNYQKTNSLEKYKNLNTNVNSIDKNEMNNLTPVSIELAYGVFAEELLLIISKYSYLEKGDLSFLVFWKNCVVDLVYKSFVDNYSRTLQNPSLINTENQRKLTYYYSFVPGSSINSTYFKNTWFEMFNKSSWLGAISLSTNQFLKFKENTIKINKLLLKDDIKETNNNFYNLTIQNTYTYRYYNSSTDLEIIDNYGRKNIKDVIYNQNKLYIRFDNYYDREIVTINTLRLGTSTSIPFDSVNYECIQNEKGFNSLYLVFNLPSSFTSKPPFKNNDVITLTVSYNNYLPIVNFYDGQVTNPYIKSTKHTYVKKTSNNVIKLNKVNSDGTIILENGSELYTNRFNNIRLLTINYLNSNYLVCPEYFDYEIVSQPIIDNNFLQPGKYGYAISFFTLSSESDVSDIKYITIPTPTVSGNNSVVKIFNIPVSENKNIIGRKIYRTKVNSTDLLLVKTITNNSDSVFIDNINDNLVGIDYKENTITKLNKLPITSTLSEKYFVRVNLTGSRYYFENATTGSELKISITTIPLISEIYMEDFAYPVSVIPSGNFNIDSNGIVKLTNTLDFSPEHLYYLTRANNPQDTIKLIPTKRKAVFVNIVSSELVSTTLNFTTGTYNYMISFYSLKTTKESLPQTFSVNLTSANKFIRLYNFPNIIDKTYDSWRLYRQKSDGFYYLLKTVNSLLETSFDDIYSDAILTIKYEEPVFTISKPINEHTINYPNIGFTVTNSTTLKPANVVAGLYKYEVTYFGANNEETKAAPYVVFQISNFLPQLNFTTPSDSRILGWKIYRSDIILSGNNPNDYITNFVGTVNISSTNKNFVDTFTTFSPPKIGTLILDPPTTFVIEDTTTDKPSTFIAGSYTYQVTYFGNNNTETIKSSAVTYTIGTKIPKITFDNPSDPNILGWKIYRNTGGTTETKLIGFLTKSNTNIFIDPLTFLNSPSTFTIGNSTLLKTSNFASGKYKYEVTFYGNNNIETFATSVDFTVSTYKPKIQLGSFTNTLNLPIIGWKIYRSDIIPTGANSADYQTKLIGTVNFMNVASTYIYTFTDILQTENTINYTYNILKIPIAGAVPNLNTFISHSTDCEYINDKKLSDVNDYVFNKPMIMLVNNQSETISSEFDSLVGQYSPLLYFYNVNFKINSTSIIRLNGNTINFLCPLSTQQFFIKPESETYYKINKNTNTIESSSNLVLQKTFNPAFDEFNLSTEFINTGYYYQAFIDGLCDKFLTFFNENPNYQKIFNIIDSTISEFNNIFVYMLNTSNIFYGQVSTRILTMGTRAASINKFYDVLSSSVYTLPLQNNFTTSSISDGDFVKFSRGALRIEENNKYYGRAFKDVIKSTLTESKYNTYKILTPFYKKYSRSNRLSSQYINSMENMSKLFTDHIEYVKNNIDYLNLSNPNNKKDKYLSNKEINQDINNTYYDYSGTTQITTLHPITDTSFDKLYITDQNNNVNTITDATNLNSYQFASSTYIDNKDENTYDDRQIISNVYNEQKKEKFNYYGVSSIDSSGNIIYNDNFIGVSTVKTRYIKFDDNQIYKGTLDTNLNRYSFSNTIADCLIVNPVEILESNIKTASNQNSSNSITLTKMTTSSYIYEYSIVFASNIGSMFSTQLSTKIILGLNQISCTIKPISSTEIKLYILSSSLINITDKQLVFLTNVSDLNSVSVTPNILSIKITGFKEANYTAPVTSELLSVNWDEVIIKIGSDYFSIDDKYIVNLDGSPTEKNIYFYINSTSTSINSPLYKKSLNASAETDTTGNYITHKLLPALTLRNSAAYSIYESSEYTKKIIETDDENYIMLISLINSQYFILKKKNIKSLQIPEGNYHTWILNKNTFDVIKLNKTYTLETNGNLLGLNNLITYSFYMVTNSNNECFYYYDSGTNILTNSPNINYYKNIVGSSSVSVTKNEIYLVDNDLFDVVNYQYIKSYKQQNLTENFLTKNIKSQQSSLIYDTNENLAFDSNFVLDNINILSNDSNTGIFEGTNEFTTNLVLKRKLSSPERKLLLPVIIKKYENIQVPMIKFISGGITYTNSIIPILMSSLTFDSDSVKTNSNVEIGKITSNHKITSLSSNISITKTNNENTIILNSGYIIPSYTSSTLNTLPYSNTTWSLQLESTNGQISIMYFNIVFVSTLTMFGDYLDLLTDTTNKIGFSQPIIASTNGEIKLENLLTNYEVLNQNIFKSNGNNLELNIVSQTYNVGYKYYENVRNKDVTSYSHEIKPLDFHGVLNIKPYLLNIINQYPITNTLITSSSPLSTSTNISSQAIFYLVNYTTRQTSSTKSEKIVSVVLNSPQSTLSTRLGSSSFTNIIQGSASYSVSYQNPLFVQNKILLFQKSELQYIITSYAKLYLEINEVILIDGNYFVVKGLNIFNNSYELDCMKQISKIKYTNKGYYTFGVYFSKEQRELPDIKVNNIITYATKQTILPGDFYISGNQLICSNQTTTIEPTTGSFCGKFSEQSLKVKLFCSNNKYYLCDNFVKIKKMDKMIYVFSQNDIRVLTVINIRNNEIIFDTELALTSNCFYDFILPYQPLKSKYVLIDSTGKITSDIEITDTTVVGMPNSVSVNKIDLFFVTNGKINGWTGLASSYWVYLMDINYKKIFTNYMQVPNIDFKMTTQHPISILTTYDKVVKGFKIDNPVILSNGFNWFFGQPIKVNGMYGFIRDIQIISTVTAPIVKSYFIKTEDYINQIFSVIPDTNLQTLMIISYSEPNINTFYLLNKFRYNYGIQILNYDMPLETKIEVVRCALKNDELIFMDKTVNNKKIVFKYGVSILENEKANGIISSEYENIYFYNYCMINKDGTISNFDTLSGTYYLHCEKNNVAIQRIYLAKIKNGNQIKIYADILSAWNYSHTISKLISIKLHYTGEFSFKFQEIVQSYKLTEINMNPIIIFNQYPIKFMNVVQLINGEYHQEIIFTTSTKVVNTKIYQVVYLNEDLTFSVKIILSNSKYYLVSSKILLNNITIIYTKNTNYLVKSQQIFKNFKQKNIADTSLDYYINTKILDTEDWVQNILVSKIEFNNTKYKYKLTDNSNYVFTAGEKYSVNSLTAKLENIDINSFVFTTENPIDIDLLEQSDDFQKLRLFTTVSIDTTGYFDQLLLFKSVKNIRLKLLELCNLKLLTICNYIKPWNKWGLLCTIKNTTGLNSLINLNKYVKWENNEAKIIYEPGNNTYSYLTNNEILRLTEFLEIVNSSETRKQNYVLWKNNIEPLILASIEKLIMVPDFYFNVVDNINKLLKSFGYDVFFDGNNIIFNNDKNPQYIIIDDEEEIAYDLSNEYTYDINQNIVYRNQTSFNSIQNQVLLWLSKTTPTVKNEILFGIGTNKLLRYIRIFGDQLLELLNNFTNELNDTPNYYFLNPMKFLVGKIWEKYCNTGNLENLEKEFTDKLIATVTFNINSNKVYNFNTTDYLLKINYYGLYSTGNNALFSYTLPLQDVNLFDVIEFNGYGIVPVQQTNGLIMNPVYKYKLNFNSSEILTNCTYFLDFLNGDKLNTSIDLGNFAFYPDQINFSSSYNIKPTDFYILNQQKTYSIISSKFLGYLYRLKVNTSYNLDFVDEIYFKNINLVIDNIDITNSSIDLLIPDLTVSTTSDVFEFRYSEFINVFSVVGNKLYLEFINPAFPFVSSKTIIIIDNQNCILQIDSNGKYYVNLSDVTSFNSKDVLIINQITGTTTILGQSLYEYQLDPPFEQTDYRPINDNYIVPLEFSIINTNTASTNKKIQPLHVHTFGDNKLVFHYTNSNNTILTGTTEKFTQILHTKRIVEDLSNEIVSIEKQEEYLYYTNVKYPVCVNTTVFVYKNITDGLPSSHVYDITPWDGITEPKFNIENKTSIYFNQETSSTYFSIKTLYTDQELKNNVGFIQKNTWDIVQTDYSIANNSLVITMPDDFVLILLQNQSYYKINNFQIQNSDISTYDNKLVIKWNPLNGDLTGSITLKQYFIEPIGKIFKPKENRKYVVTLEYPYQYLSTTNFYMYQYDGEASKFDNYLYLIETSEQSTGDSIFLQSVPPKSTMQLISGTKIFLVKILDQVRANNKVCYVVSYFEKLDVNLQYTYHFNDFKINLVNKISFYQDSLQFAKFYNQTELNVINLFMNDSVNDFKMFKPVTTTTTTTVNNITTTTTTTSTKPTYSPFTTAISNPAKFYLVSYEKSELTNLFYSNEFKQNINMNKIVEYNQNTITSNIVPKFTDCNKFFSSIKLYFNDQLVEELSENTYLIDKYLYSTEETRNQKNKMCDIKFDGKKWYFYLPLIFWYSCKPGLSIPTVAMPNTQIRLKYSLNDVAYALTNTLTNTSDTTFTFTNKPTVNLSLITDYILLDNSERKLFGNNAHEYIIDRYKICPDTYITSEESVVKCNFKGLVKDIHLISRPSSNPKLTYYPVINTKYDAKYNTYVKAYYFYLDLLAYGKYRTDEQRNYAVDIELIKTNENKYVLYKMSTDKTSSSFFQIYRLTEWFSSWSIWSEDLLKYLMYYETKYLSEITDYKRKEYLIAMYLKYQFSDAYETQTISPIESLLFKANGTALFSERDYTYFTDVVPYQKFNNSLPNGHYAYTFSLHPTEDQHSGHLNFSNFDDVIMRVKSNPKVKSDPYSLSTVLKEYNILRFMSGHSSLAWL